MALGFWTGKEAARWHVRAAPPARTKLRGRGGGQARDRAQRGAGAHEPIPASSASCGSVRGCGRRRRHAAGRGFPERGPPAPDTPSARRPTAGGGTAPVSMTTAGNKQGARHPPPAGNGRRLPLPAPWAGVHCVPGRSPPLTPARPSRLSCAARPRPLGLRERARCHHVRSPHSFHWRLPREGPSCALNSSLRRKGQAFPIQHRSQGGQPVVRNVQPTGGQAWAGGGGLPRSLRGAPGPA